MPQRSLAAVSSRRLFAVAILAAALPAILLSSSRATTPVFGEPFALPNGGVSEPGIDVGPDGTVFVNGINGLPTHSRMWRSTDDGASYQPLSFNNPYNRFPGGGDADVVVGDDERVYFLDLSAVSNSIARSENNGETWVEGTPFTTLPVSDRQWISLGSRDPVTGKDTVYVVYHFIQLPGNLMFARSRDGGLTWDWHTAPYGLGGALPGQLVSDGDFVAFNYESQGHMYLVRSFDAGTTWTRHQVTMVQEATTNLTAVAMDGDDMYIAWINRFDYSVRVAHSPDRGSSWTRIEDEQLVPNIQTVGSGGTAMFPWIAARNGKVAVTWYGADNATGNPDNVPAGTEWRLKYVEADPFGSGFTAPVDASQGVVKRGFICTQGVTCTAGRELGDFQQVAIDLDGKSLITYVDLICDPYCRGANVVKQL